MDAIHPYAVVGLFLSVAFLIGVAPLALAWLLRPHKLSARKAQTYEIGDPTCGESRIESKSQVFGFVLVFLVFGVSLAFLLPWVLAFAWLPLSAIVKGLITLVPLGIGFAYASRKGWLTWI
jgi:NADH-quinone oxidoreductase subunit A